MVIKLLEEIGLAAFVFTKKLSEGRSRDKSNTSSMANEKIEILFCYERTPQMTKTRHGSVLTVALEAFECR